MICVFREVSYSNYLFSTKIINTIYEKWVEEEPKDQPQLEERTWANYAGDCWRWWEVRSGDGRWRDMFTRQPARTLSMNGDLEICTVWRRGGWEHSISGEFKSQTNWLSSVAVSRLNLRYELFHSENETFHFLISPHQTDWKVAPACSSLFLTR